MSDLDESGTMWIGVDGEIKRQGEGSVAALEAGSSVGWGVFTTGAIVRARPILLARHIERLRGDAIRSGLLPAAASQDEAWSASWNQVLLRLIEANGVQRGVFRLTLCARGEGRWHAEGPPRAIVAAVAIDMEAAPVEAWLSPYYVDARRPLSGVKSTSYAPWHLMALEARERGCGEALYRDSGGAMCEGARSNLFWRRGPELCTPGLSTGCLPGIGRALLLSWLREPGSPWSVREGSEPGSELLRADEIFLSSSTLGPRAVTLLRGEDGVLWRSEGEGPACRMLRERWRRMAEVESVALAE